MKHIVRLCVFVLLALRPIGAQANPTQSLNDDEITTKATQAGALAEEGKYPEALALYREVIPYYENNASVFYNAALCAYSTKHYDEAIRWWKRVKEIDPDDWMARAKLVQSFQATGDISARDAERAELLKLRSSKLNKELAGAKQYCRDQFFVGTRRVMAFENFEMTGERAVRYTFEVLNERGKRDYTISLGSYDLTNSIWARENKELAAKGQRLFHLDGYYDWGHATLGFYSPEPSYEDVKSEVVKVLEGKGEVLSKTVVPGKSSPADVYIKGDDQK